MNNENLLVALNAIKTKEELLSIGEQREHTLHRVIKYMIDPSLQYQEIKVDKKIVDVYMDNKIYEIQTKSFGNLRTKLEVLLVNHKVQIIYPCIINKQIIKFNENGEVITNRKSPKKVLPIHSLVEFYRIKTYLDNPNLEIRILLIDIDEYQQQVKKTYRNRHGKERVDQVPTRIIGEIIIYNKEGYYKLLPTLNEEFTALEFYKASKIGSYHGSFIISVLKYLNIIEQVGKKGKAYIYKIKSC